jgi:50S ribosomal protein L16 3-hydroxylase
MPRPVEPLAVPAPSAAGPLATRAGAAAFLRRHWQKKSLLVRGAFPRFGGLFTAAALKALAARDDVESRLVVRAGKRWSLSHGPFRRADFRALPERDWTLLVQGVNLHSRAADALLRRFAFVPFARLDDLMVSLAAPGGGVGPHYDSYDVFLLQGSGRRRWRYGRQTALALKPGLPLKILRRFEPKHDDVLNPGDMLYLPPAFAHDGVAIDLCTTYSIGFRAPDAGELGAAFLDFLRDRLDLAGRYADADLTPAREPARIPRPLQQRSAEMIAAIRWDRAVIDEFVGCFLSEPKPSVFFVPPERPLSLTAFLARAERRGVRLDPRTRLLYDDRWVYVNGTAQRRPAAGTAALREFANARTLSATAVRAAASGLAHLLHGWYRHGYLHAD